MTWLAHISMCACAHLMLYHTHTHSHMHIHTHSHTYIYTHMHTHTHTHTHAYTHIHTHTHTHTCTHTHTQYISWMHSYNYAISAALRMPQYRMKAKNLATEQGLLTGEKKKGVSKVQRGVGHDTRPLDATRQHN